MYRHFAVLTVAITALLAFFANGENHKAAAVAAGREPPARALTVRPKPSLVTEAVEDPGSWGSDESDGFGEPMMISSSGGFGAAISRPFAAVGASRAAIRDGSRLASEGSGDEPTEATPAAAPSAAQIAAAAAASRLRSGAPADD